jgi:hypothetical protein
MAGPSKFGPPGGPLSGGLEASVDYANQANKAAQEKQKAIFEAKQALAPKENAPPKENAKGKDDPGR